jgi:hypothetical protein
MESNMRKTILLALCAGFGVLVFSADKPAVATPATPAVQVGETEAGVITVGRRDRYWRRHHYAYRPYPYYYRPYAFYRPYPYYHGYPYYYRRPGLSFGFFF